MNYDIYLPSYLNFREKTQKGVIRIRKSKKDRQDNGHKKKGKRTNTNVQNIEIKLKIELQEPQ